MSKKDIKRARKVLEDYRNELLIEMESLDNVLECSLENYDFMIDFAIKMGFTRVVDIGCAYGHQAELCRGRIYYEGINENELNFYDNYTIEFSYDDVKYPQDNYFYGNCHKALAISNLALGWNCYNTENEFEDICKHLIEDFKASLLYIPKDREHILRKCFKNVEIVKDEPNGPVPAAFYYCYNSEQKEERKWK